MATKRKPVTVDQAGNVLSGDFSNPDADGNTGPGEGAVTISVSPLPPSSDWFQPPKVYILAGLAAVLAYALYKDTKQ